MIDLASVTVPQHPASKFLVLCYSSRASLIVASKFMALCYSSTTFFIAVSKFKFKLKKNKPLITSCNTIKTTQTHKYTNTIRQTNHKRQTDYRGSASSKYKDSEKRSVQCEWQRGEQTSKNSNIYMYAVFPSPWERTLISGFFNLAVTYLCSDIITAKPIVQFQSPLSIFDNSYQRRSSCTQPSVKS